MSKGTNKLIKSFIVTVFAGMLAYGTVSGAGDIAAAKSTSEAKVAGTFTDTSEGGTFDSTEDGQQKEETLGLEGGEGEIVEGTTTFRYVGLPVIDLYENPNFEEQNPEEQSPEEQSPEEQVPELEYEVEEMSAVKYASQDANVRSGPSVDFERVGHLSLNQEVTVTGRATTGWYRISYNGEEAFVSHTLLADQPVVIQEPEPQPQNPEPQNPEQPSGPQTEEEFIQQVVNMIYSPEKNAFQLAAEVNNYLCGHMTYDYTFTHRSTYDALAYGIGVCQGYANAFTKIMNAMGITTDYVAGQGWTGVEWGSHAWNRTLVDGVWYYTDVTWNDCLSQNKYLMISYDEISYDHYEEMINPYRVE